jgi:hypothetical protein
MANRVTGSCSASGFSVQSYRLSFNNIEQEFLTSLKGIGSFAQLEHEGNLTSLLTFG